MKGNCDSFAGITLYLRKWLLRLDGIMNHLKLQGVTAIEIFSSISRIAAITASAYW